MPYEKYGPILSDGRQFSIMYRGHLSSGGIEVYDVMCIKGGQRVRLRFGKPVVRARKMLAERQWKCGSLVASLTTAGLDYVVG